VDPWVLDLDGVVWRGDDPIPGASSAVASLRAAGHPVWCCTNNSAATVADYETKLDAHGIVHDGLITSAMAMATLVGRGERIMACAEDGAREALAEVGAIVVPDDTAVDAVVVGFHRDFDYAEMQRATRAVLGGARLIATNDDPIYPDHDGPSPGCGAILASIERATGVRATVAGKPNRPMADLLRARCGDHGVFVGDSLGTDGAMAAALGWRFGLVLTGNTSRDAAGSAGATWVAEDLAWLVDHVVGTADAGEAGPGEAGPGEAR
jgi:HAD superfamily hydrolase (TIGR01450 family)